MKNFFWFVCCYVERSLFFGRYRNIFSKYLMYFMYVRLGKNNE